MSRRGFTLVELVATIGVLGVVAAAAYALLLEAKVSAARLEAEVELVRQATIAGEWLARDLRAADAVEPVSGTLELIAPGERRVVYKVDGERLVRVDGELVQPIARGVAAIEARRTLSARGWHVSLTMLRPLLVGRDVRLVRDVVVGDRR